MNGKERIKKKRRSDQVKRVQRNVRLAVDNCLWSVRVETP